MPSKGFQKVIIARSQLVLNEPFWAPLITKPEVVEDPRAYKMWTDGGVHFGFNPKWAADDRTTIDDIISRICEMTVHVSNEHHFRMIGMDPEDANKAADYASWAILKNAGYPMPNDVYYDARYDGLSFEAVYNLIHVEKPAQPEPQQAPGSGDGDGDQDAEGEPEEDGDEDQDGDQESDKPAKNPGSDGEIRPLPANVNAEEHRHEWREAVLQAAQAAEAAGKMPAGMRRVVDRIKNPAVDWRVTLRKFIQQTARSDFSWQRPSRRYAPQGVYLPILTSEQLPPIVIGIDTSASIDQEQLDVFAAEMTGIAAECHPEKVHVIYCDAKVQSEEEFEQDEDIVLRAKGGGGTDLTKCLDWVNEKQIEPACVVIFTDMLTPFGRPQEFPVIWVTESTIVAPHGETIRIQDE
jgi:predicted metal-dependent peptidase